jgi:SOS-response transcriptional repressor LexA
MLRSLAQRMIRTSYFAGMLPLRRHDIAVFMFTPMSFANSRVVGQSLMSVSMIVQNALRALARQQCKLHVAVCYAESMSAANRLKQAREAKGFETAAEASRRFGWNASTYQQHENETRSITMKSAKVYSEMLGVTPEWIMFGTESSRASVPVMGHVAAGSEIFTATSGELDRIEPPPGARSEAVAVIVRGDSMFPRYFSGDILIYDEHMPPRHADGQECVVQMLDGRTLVKVVRFRAGTVTLESYNSPPIYDAAIEWVAPIKWVKRAVS